MNPHLMFDLETLSQEPTAAIISIGACTFTPHGIGDTFRCNIKPESSKAFGLTISEDTVKWWSERPKEVRDAVLTKNVNLDFGLQAFHDWYKKTNPSYVWSLGTTFDIIIAEYAFKRTKIDIPWHFRQVQDARTLFNLFGIKSTDLHAAEGSMHHDALADSITQTKAIIAVLKAMGWGEKDSPIKV